MKRLTVAILLFLSVLGFHPLADAKASTCSALFISQESKSHSSTSSAAAIYFRQLAKDQWRYYADNVNATTNFLPPDNVKIEKGNPLAADYRTSPTNIGLYMLSTMAAQKIGLIGLQEALTRLRQTVSTIKKLPKFTQTINGLRVEHLYNWYSINGKPAEIGDRFISTVDNGNLSAFLVATLTAVGRADPVLVRDLQNIVERMRFDVLFDSKKNALFHGAQVNDGRLNFTSGHYDMLISEARSAYAIAIMLGHIPPTAWTGLKSKLGSELANIESNPELKFQSYTGTMFEYLTPRLLMKHGGTPLGEADSQALRLQMADTVGGIWGKSEANSNTSRGYAAWGVRSLSQSKEFTTTGDQVIAPYASQMAAGLAPEAVFENLKAMDKLGFRERYGQFESVTIKGRGRELRYHVTPQFYAHHIGMGFVALANHLHKDFAVEWVHQSTYNKNHTLENLLSTASDAYKKPSNRKHVAKTNGGNAYAYEPKAKGKSEIIGNGEFVAHVPGIGGSTWLGKNFALSHNEVFFVRDVKTNQLLPLTLKPPKPVRGTNGAKPFDYTFPQPNGGSLDVSVAISISSASKTKVSKITVTNRTGSNKELEVTGYLDWIMDDVNAYLNHPVYRNLFTLTSLDKSGRIVTARRRTMQGAEQERQPFGYLALGNETPGAADRADGSRTHFLGRLGNLSAPHSVFQQKSKGEFGATLDPAAALSKSVTVPAGKSKEITFVLGFADSEALIPQLIASASSSATGSALAAKHGVPTLPPDGTYDRMRELSRRTNRQVRISSKPEPTAHLDIPPEKIGRWAEGGKFIIENPFAPKKPWSMVVSNGKYGFVATHTGWVYSFGSNSQQARVTPYIPDTTSESPVRGVIVKDKKSGESWSITPNPAPLKDGHYEVEVAPGYIEYRFRGKDGLSMAMKMFVAKKNPLEA